MEIKASGNFNTYLYYNKGFQMRWNKSKYNKPKYTDLFYHIPMGDGYHVIKLEDVEECVLYYDKEAYDFTLLFDGKHSFEEICSLHREKYPESTAENMCDAYRKLIELDLIIEGESSTDVDVEEDYYQRQERQVRFFAHFETDKMNKWDFQKKIRDCKIIVLGAGGTGSQALLYLAASGFGNITCVDFDKVEITNLNRQILYKAEDVGKSKIMQAKERILEFNPTINFTAYHEKIADYDRLVELLKGQDFCICCADVPPIYIRSIINKATVEVGIPTMYGGIYADHVNIGPMVIPHQTGCFHCWNEARCQLDPNYKEYLDYILETEKRTGTSASNVWIYGTTGAGIAMGIGGMVMDIMRYVSGYATPVCVGKQIKVNLLTLQTEVLNWPKIATCPICGSKH